jgi:hypothetical protein
MYQINLRAQASKLAALTPRWPLILAQQRATLAELASFATLRVMLGGAPASAQRHDPRNPHNW